MPTDSRTGGLIGVVCDDRTSVRRTVSGLLTACGFGVTAETADFSALRAAVRRFAPSVAVVTLPVTGMNGLAAVRALRHEEPGCRIVLLCAFDELHLAALEAGAFALLPEDQPLALQQVLRRVAGDSPTPAYAEAGTSAADCAGSSSTKPPS